MSLCRKYDYFHAFFIPLVKYGAVYWATCPKCASVFSLRKEVGDAIHQGKMIPIEEQDLELVRNNYLPSCPACGAPQVPGSLFCNRCGAKL